MTQTVSANLSILPGEQRQLYAELGTVPDIFTLYGGTAIALQLGHRESVDFDFFAFTDIDTDQLYEQMPFLQGSREIQREPNTLTVLIDRGAPVQVSFFGLPKLHALCSSKKTDDATALRIASLLDLAGMKAAVVQKRAEAKDYIDIAAIIAETDITLAAALTAATALYPNLNPELSLKALCFYDDGNLAAVPETVRIQLQTAVRNVNLAALPDIENLCT